MSSLSFARIRVIATHTFWSQRITSLSATKSCSFAQPLAKFLFLRVNIPQEYGHSSEISFLEILGREHLQRALPWSSEDSGKGRSDPSQTRRGRRERRQLLSLSLSIYLSLSLSIYIYICIYTYTYYMCVYIYIYTYMYVCTYIYIYIYM